MAQTPLLHQLPIETLVKIFEFVCSRDRISSQRMTKYRRVSRAWRDRIGAQVPILWNIRRWPTDVQQMNQIFHRVAGIILPVSANFANRPEKPEDFLLPVASSLRSLQLPQTITLSTTRKLLSPLTSLHSLTIQSLEIERQTEEDVFSAVPKFVMEEFANRVQLRELVVDSSYVSSGSATRWDLCSIPASIERFFLHRGCGTDLICSNPQSIFLPNLTALAIPFSAKLNFSFLSQLKNLSSFLLRCSSAFDNWSEEQMSQLSLGLSRLPKLKNLSLLTYVGTSPNFGAMKFGSLTQIRSLRISSYSLTRTTIPLMIELGKLNGRLESLVIQSAQIDESVFRGMSRLDSLRSLWIECPHPDNEEGEFSAREFESFRSLTRLESLFLDFAFLRPPRPEFLSQFTSLRVLHMIGRSDHNYKSLIAPSLQSLTLDGFSVSNDDIEEIRRKCEDLREMILHRVVMPKKDAIALRKDLISVAKLDESRKVISAELRFGSGVSSYWPWSLFYEPSAADSSYRLNP